MVTGTLVILSTATAIFWVHGRAKMRDLRAFAAAVGTWNVVPVRHAWIVALVLPVFEVTLAIWLAVGILTSALFGQMLIAQIAALATVATSVAFVIVQGYILTHGGSGTCGCAGASGDAIGWRSIAKAAVLGVSCIPFLAVAS